MMLVKRIRLVGHLIHCYSPRWVMVAWKEFGLVWRKFDTQFRPGEYKENSKTFLIPTPINKIRIRNAGGTFSPPAKVIVEGIPYNIEITVRQPPACYGIEDYTYEI